MIDIIAQIQNYFTEHYAKWIFVVVILVAGFIVIKIFGKYLVHIFDKVDFDKSLKIFLVKTAKIFLWIILLMIIFANLGFDVTGFIAGLGVMGFIIGFATKDVLSNLAAGIFLLIQRPLRVGETVEVAKIKGKVKEMNISSCIIITPENEYVTVPNSKVWGNPIKNYSRIKK